MTWQDDLTHNGIMMEEDSVVSALSDGANEKAELAGTTVSIQESDFCTSLDTAICELASSFVDSNETVFSSDLASLCSAAGYNTVVYGAPANAVILKNGGVRFDSEYVAQRKAILNLFITVKANEAILAESISLHCDRMFVNKHFSQHYTISPENATTNLVWTTDKNKTGTHFSSNELTVDGNGVITLHDGWVQGTPVFQKITDTVSNISSDWLLFNYTGIKGYYCAPGKNVLAKLIAAYQGTYTQNGITMTHNSDGTITLDGTSSAGNDAYQRFVIWPIGNNKSANNIPLLLANANAVHVEWIHPIVDFPEDASTLSTSGVSKRYESYQMSYSTQIGTKIERTNGDTEHWYATAFDSTKTLTAVVLGIQIKQGTRLDNVTFEVGVQAYPDSSLVKYGGELENYLAYDDVVLHKTNTTIDLILRCYHNGSFQTYSRGYNFYIGTLYYRLTQSLLESNNLNDLVTEDEFGTIGHTYQLDFNWVSGEVQDSANSTKLGILLIDSTGAIIASAYVVNNPSTTGINTISAQTISETFTLDRKINAAVLHMHDIRQRSSIMSFNITLTDITNTQQSE